MTNSCLNLKTILTNCYFGTFDQSKKLFLFLCVFLLPTLSLAQVSWTTCPAGSPSPGYSQSQENNLVAEGVGLDYIVAGGECGQPLTYTLPPGAIPVTAFAYVEYDIGGNSGGPNYSAINFSGNASPAGVEVGPPVTWTVFQNIMYDMRYSLSPGWFTAGANSDTISTSEVGGCAGQSVMVLYIDPSQTSNNAVVISDGNNAWHVEENNQIIPGNGVAPPDSQLNWNCLGMSCSSSNLKFSAVGGRNNCNDGSIDGDEDQIEQYGSGGVTTNSGGTQNGTPTLWSGPPGVLNCGGKGIPGDHDRTYNLGNFQSGATSMEWGFFMNIQNAKASFWQQALVAQYQCNPVSQCSVTNVFNQSLPAPPSGWEIGQVPWGEGNWVESGGSLYYQNGSGVAPTYNYLLNNTVPAAPGTLLVSMCMGGRERFALQRDCPGNGSYYGQWLRYRFL